MEASKAPSLTPKRATHWCETKSRTQQVFNQFPLGLLFAYSWRGCARLPSRCPHFVTFAFLFCWKKQLQPANAFKAGTPRKEWNKRLALLSLSLPTSPVHKLFMTTGGGRWKLSQPSTFVFLRQTSFRPWKIRAEDVLPSFEFHRFGRDFRSAVKVNLC